MATSMIRLEAVMPLKRHGIYITNPQNMVAHSRSYQVEVHRSFHIQSFSQRENSARPSSPRTQYQNCSSESVNYLGLAEKLFCLARGRSPFLVWTAYRGPRCPGLTIPSMRCLKSLSSPTEKP